MILVVLTITSYRLLHNFEVDKSNEVLRNVAVSLNYSYSDYNEKSPYVYGYLGGQYQSLTAFLTLRF